MTAGESSHNRSLGAQGEEIAVAFLEGRKFKVLERNFRCKGGEVDIVARDGRTLIFIEVKTRRTLEFGPPQAAVTLFKQRQISKAALTWLAKNRLTEAPARFDVVAVLLRDGAAPFIEHIPNAFDLAY